MLDNIKLPRLNFSDLKLSELDINTSTAGLAAAGIVVILLVRRATQGPKAPLPPGPPRKPIVGNYLDLPAKEGWILPKLFRDLGRSFGSELVYANLCGAHVIVVNTAEAANDLFQHRANIYSSRPQLNALRRILGMTWLTAIMPSDDYWKATRKSFGIYFRAPSYHELETLSAHALLRALLKTPDDFLAHFRRMNTASTMAITYGVDMDEEGAQEAERYVGIGERVLQALVYGTSLFALAFDAIPALVNAPNWLLGGQFKRDAVPRAEHSRDMLEEPFKDVQRALAQGKAKPSVVYNMLSNAQTKEDEALAKVTGANVYFSGVNNMNSALGAFVMAMAKYPEAQKRAQAEIDAVVGTDRLPEFADHVSLPFVEAIVKEVLRWKPVTPLAIPHAAAEEDVYKGYRIPKGAIVIGNSWAMLHDETTYPDPENFKPERWLTWPAGDFPFAAFGFGRRLCPGLAYVRDSLWITIASLLATYDIALAVDAAGAPIVLDEEWTPTLFSFPAPFKASITPRSDAARQLALTTASEGPLTGA